MLGKAKAYLPRTPGLVGVGDIPGWDFLYRHSTVRDPKFFVGDRVVLPDSRVFRYANAGNIISHCKYGVKFWKQIGDGVAAVLAQGQSVGDREITIAAAGVVADEFRGGYVMIHVGTHQQFRGVLGNTATNAAGTITVYLDAELTVAVTVAHYTEILHNPYSEVRIACAEAGGSGNDYSSVAGIPNVITAVANEYLWLQTWGPIWINSHGSSLQDAGITGGERKLVFDCEGSVCVVDDVAHGPCGAGGDEQQLAGFIIDRSAAGTSGPPLVMLQISP